MTDEQRKRMEELTKQVKSDYRTMSEPKIIGRIMLISGKGFVSACKGYEIMVAEKMFDKFVLRDGYGSLQRIIDKNPAVLDAILQLDLIPQGCEVRKFEGWEMPKKYSPEHLGISLPPATF